MPKAKKSNADFFNRLVVQRHDALKAKFGRRLADEVHADLCVAMMYLSAAACKIEEKGKDPRDLFLIFTQSISDTNNAIQAARKP